MQTTEHAIAIERLLKTTPREAYNAWIEPDKFTAWMSDINFPAKVVEMDARAGGRYRFDVTGPEGEVHSTAGEYRELVPGEKLVMTWVYTGPHPDADRGESLVTVTFRDAGSGITAITLKHEQIGTESGAETLKTGWGGCIEQLERYFGGSAG